MFYKAEQRFCVIKVVVITGYSVTMINDAVILNPLRADFFL